MKYPYLALTILILTLTSCGKQPEKLYAWVDNVNMRANPDPSLPAIAHLNEGQEVIFYGQVGTNMATYTLRGQEITAPFVKVQYGTNTNMTAWVFKGALKSYTECGINSNLGLIDAIKCSNIISVKYLVENGKVATDGQEKTIRAAVDTAIRCGLIDIAQYLLDKRHLTYQGNDLLSRLPAPKAGVWLENYIISIFGPVQKVVTNTYKPEKIYGESAEIDIDYYYKFDVKIKHTQYYDGGGGVYYIPYTTVEQAFTFMEQFDLPLMKELRFIKDFRFPKKSEKIHINDTYFFITVESDVKGIKFIKIENGDEYMSIERAKNGQVKISMGGGA